jgi:hypothetical protein
MAKKVYQTILANKKAFGVKTTRNEMEKVIPFTFIERETFKAL